MSLPPPPPDRSMYGSAPPPPPARSGVSQPPMSSQRGHAGDDGSMELGPVVPSQQGEWGDPYAVDRNGNWVQPQQGPRLVDIPQQERRSSGSAVGIIFKTVGIVFGAGFLILVGYFAFQYMFGGTPIDRRKMVATLSNNPDDTIVYMDFERMYNSNLRSALSAKKTTAFDPATLNEMIIVIHNPNAAMPDLTFLMRTKKTIPTGGSRQTVRGYTVYTDKLGPRDLYVVELERRLYVASTSMPQMDGILERYKMSSPPMDPNVAQVFHQVSTADLFVLTNGKVAKNGTLETAIALKLNDTDISVYGKAVCNSPGEAERLKSKNIFTDGSTDNEFADNILQSARNLQMKADGKIVSTEGKVTYEDFKNRMH